MGLRVRSEVVVISVEIALGAVTNLLLILALAHTWKHWRQVKYYVVIMTVGNVLEVTFTLGTLLDSLGTSGWNASRGACKFFYFMYVLGPSLANMALAALALHVLLTSITGNQGNRTRHALVMGLFVLLSLPLPFTQIPIYDLYPTDEPIKYCYAVGIWGATEEKRLAYSIGQSVAMDFFPLFVFLATSLAALALKFRGDAVKTDVSGWDLALTGVLGLVVTICCVPSTSMHLHFAVKPYISYGVIVRVYENLIFLRYTRPILAAVVCILFGYIHAFKNRDQGSYQEMRGERSGTGEKQRLVN